MHIGLVKSTGRKSDWKLFELRYSEFQRTIDAEQS
jgi:hypothetical protein